MEELKSNLSVFILKCETLYLEPTKQNALELFQCCQKIEEINYYKYKESNIILLLSTFDRVSEIANVSYEVLRYVVDSYKHLLSLTFVQNKNVFFKSYDLLFSSMRNKNNNNELIVGAIPEEYLLSVLQCVKILIKSATTDLIDEFFEPVFSVKIAWGISFCKAIAENEKMKKLRVEALECILFLTYCHDDVDNSDIVLKEKAKHCVIKCVPGILSAALNACLNLEEHHKIVQMGVRLWARTILLVLDDYDDRYDDVFNFDEQLKNVSNSCSTTTPKEENAERDEIKEFIEKANGNLVRLSEKIILTQSHSHVDVVLELIDGVDKILTTCIHNMLSSLNILLECLINLSENTNELISSSSLAALNKMSAIQNDNEILFELFEECFYSFLSRYPRVSLTTDTITNLNILTGYIRLLGHHLPIFLYSRNHLNRLLYCLIHTVKLDVSNIPLTTVCSIRDLSNDTSFVNRNFKRTILSNEEIIINKMDKLCSIIKENTNLPTIVHTLLDSINEFHGYTNEILLILNSLLTNGPEGCLIEHSQLLKEVFNFYLELDIWPASQILDQSSEFTGIRDNQIKIVQLCLTIEGIGKMARVVGSDVFKPWLLQCLFAILEAAGSSHEIISVTGLTALYDMANCCYNGDLTLLIRDNTDYLSYHVTTKLRLYQRHPGILAVLSVIMKYSSVDVLPSLQEIISDVLQQSYDSFQSNNMDAYFRAFLTFISSVKKWSLEDQNCISALCDAVDEKPNENNILQLLLDHQKSKRIVENLELDEESDDDDELSIEEKLKKYHKENVNDENSDQQLNEEEAPKKDVPLHIQLVVDIITRILHFLPTKNINHRILILEIIEEGILLLKDYPDQLLPLVHLIWSPLVNRFKVELNEPLIIHRAFILLETLAFVSRDFIRQRTLKEVIPLICKFLKDKSKGSKLKDSKSAYRHSQMYKLQKCILERLGNLAINADFSLKDVYDVIDSSSPYLSSLQPQPLQDACTSLFIILGNKKYPDLVWLYLLGIWSPVQVVKSISPLLPTIELPFYKDTEYSKNIKLIFDAIN